MQKLKLQFKIQKYLIAVAFTLIAGPVFAAEISVNVPSKEIKFGSQFEVILFINTKGEDINAIQGKFFYPTDLVELKEIKYANSVMTFWVEQPRSDSSDSIIFSGITPGGYIGEKGFLFSAIFQAKREGSGTFNIGDAKVLKNDGMGTATKLSIFNYQFSISETAHLLAPITETKDNEKPESFKPEIARNPTLFGGKWLLFFATQDKKIGIDYYKVKETRYRILGLFSKWILSESPHILKDQELRSYIFVKATDKTGNERVMKIFPENPLRWYENYENWIIIILGFVIVYTIQKFLRRKNKK